MLIFHDLCFATGLVVIAILGMIITTLSVVAAALWIVELL